MNSVCAEAHPRRWGSVGAGPALCVWGWGGDGVRAAAHHSGLVLVDGHEELLDRARLLLLRRRPQPRGPHVIDPLLLDPLCLQPRLLRQHRQPRRLARRLAVALELGLPLLLRLLRRGQLGPRRLAVGWIMALSGTQRKANRQQITTFKLAHRPCRSGR
jgi:hypothetical protein